MWYISYETKDLADRLERHPTGTTRDMALPAAVTMMALRLFGLDNAVYIEEGDGRTRKFELRAVITYVPGARPSDDWPDEPGRD